MSKAVDIATSIIEKVKEVTNLSSTETIELAETRRDVCSACPDRTYDNIFKADMCKNCGCFIQLKTLNKTQTCPIGRW